MKWSTYQDNIFEAYTFSQNDLLIKAGPGSAKTTTMLECMRRTSPIKKAIFLAFNKSIQEELSSKVREGIETKTIHAKGLGVLMYNFKVKPKINDDKCFSIASKLLILNDIPYKQHMKYLFDIQNIWNRVRVTLVTVEQETIENICIDLDVEFKERMVSDILDIQRYWDKDMERLGSKTIELQIDFTDMLYIPYMLVEDKDFPKYDVVFIDEGQDLNVLQRKLVLRFVRKRGGRFMIVGDERQAIYGFQGASIENFQEFGRLPNVKTLPLSITYRCARSIVREAEAVFPGQIEAAPDAIEGEVISGEFIDAMPGDFIVCRNNVPLAKAFLRLLQENKKARILGKDLGESLLKVLNKIESLHDLDALLEDKLQKLIHKGLSYKMATSNKSYIALQEKVEILQVLGEEFREIEDLKDKMETIFIEEKDKEFIILCTIHKSKGLEADNVYFLNEYLIPSQYATTPSQLYAEDCLRFVAITRAKNKLIYCYI